MIAPTQKRDRNRAKNTRAKMKCRPVADHIICVQLKNMRAELMKVVRPIHFLCIILCFRTEKGEITYDGIF